jgi:hypothetical protein
MQGTLVVDERIYPISRIDLSKGRINFWVGPLSPPVDLPARSEVRIHAPDGSLVAVAPWDIPAYELRQIARMEPGDIVHVCLPVGFHSMIGWPRQAA